MKLGHFFHPVYKKEFTGVLKEGVVVEFDAMTPGKILAEHPLTELEVLAPVRPSKIIGVGLNYRRHALELDMPIPSEPVLFLKPPTALLAPQTPIIRPRGISRVDYEGELALVIRKTTRCISTAQAPDHILGYLPFNDVTAREKQSQDGQWARAKGYDTFAPCGPFIETEIPDPDNLPLRTWLNEQLVQDSHTSDMIFSVFELVAFCSEVMTLQPGDIITTGTPSGIGPMQDGDKVRIEVGDMDPLINTLQASS